jgi:LysM repeat protein
MQSTALLHRRRPASSGRAQPGKQSDRVGSYPGKGTHRRTLAVAGATVLMVAVLGVLGLAWPVSAGAATVTVARGETLTQIARTYGTTVPALASANNLADPNMVKAGTVLQVPSSTAAVSSPASPAPASPTTVVVTAGQSLWSIANHYGTTVPALASANGIADTAHVLIGASLVIPRAFGVVSLPVAVTESTSSTSSTLPPALLAQPQLLTLLPIFQRWSSYFGVSAPLLEGMCWWESGWQAGVVSPTGAVGIGQLEPITVTTLTGELGNHSLNPVSASDNIEMAAAYLQQLLVENGGNQSMALADYYQGRTSVTLTGMLPSTVQYVNGVLGAAALFS